MSEFTPTELPEIIPVRNELVLARAAHDQADLDAAYALLEENRAFLTPGQPWAESMTKAGLQAKYAEYGMLPPSSFVQYRITHPESEYPIGQIGTVTAYAAEDDVQRDQRHIGYFMAESYTGQGIATDSVRAFVGTLATHWGLRAVQYEIFPDNIASQRVATKMGAFPTSRTVKGYDNRPLLRVWRQEIAQ